MLKTGKIKIYLASTLLIVFVWGGFSSNMVSGQVDPISNMQKKLGGISEEKKEVVQNLFTIMQEIEELEREEDAAAWEIAVIKQEVRGLAGRIADEEIAYENKRDILKEVLRSYQRRGPGSFLEIILNSDNLTMVLRRINTFRDLTRNMGELLESLEEGKEKLAVERRNLAEKLVSMENKQESLRQIIAKGLRIEEDQEKYLASLEEESAYYREHLANIEHSWKELKLLFPEITREISRIIEDGDFPIDSIKITFSLTGIQGTIDEQTFNDIIADHSLLSEMILRFEPGKVEVKLPKNDLVLTGKFVVQEGHSLNFVAEEGFFYGLPLEISAIEELFRENDLLFNFETPLGGSMLDSIEIMEGYLEFKIKTALF